MIDNMCLIIQTIAAAVDCGNIESVEEIIPEWNNSVETLRVVAGLFFVVSVFHVCKIIKIIDRL